MIARISLRCIVKPPNLRELVFSIVCKTAETADVVFVMIIAALLTALLHLYFSVGKVEAVLSADSLNRGWFSLGVETKRRR